MKSIPKSKDQLTLLASEGARFDYTFFWGHQKSKDGSITKSCFSQWWPSPFSAHELQFATAEHYIMYRKALLFGDAVATEAVLNRLLKKSEIRHAHT